MKKLLLILITASIMNSLSAQKAVETTHEFVVEGLVKKNLIVTLDSIKKYPTTSIDSIVITNHLGQRKSTLKNIKVIPVKIFLDQLEIEVESPRFLSEVYFVFTATDGYTVVYSWNEIFNHPSGKEIFIICEKNGASIENLEDRISVISSTDVMTGRRYVKSLKKIVVKQVE